MSADSTLTPTPKFMGHPAVRIGLYAVGLALLAGAVFVVVRDRESIERALSHASRAPWWMFVLLLGLPVLNWLLSSAMFTILTRRFGDVRFGEMLWLIGASWLLNYLPLRPGLVARVAYLKAVHGVRLIDSGRIGIEAAACTVASAGIVALLALLERTMGMWPSAIINAALLAMGLSLVIDASRQTSQSAASPQSRVYAAALGLRVADMLVQGLRIRLAFDVIGVPIQTPDALLLAGPAQIVSLTPIQLGAVEFTVGLLARQTHDGVTAALLNRAADMLVAVPVGVTALAWLYRRRARPQRRHRPPVDK
jgi:hypothetical protein